MIKFQINTKLKKKNKNYTHLIRTTLKIAILMEDRKLAKEMDL